MEVFPVRRKYNLTPHIAASTLPFASTLTATYQKVNLHFNGGLNQLTFLLKASERVKRARLSEKKYIRLESEEEKLGHTGPYLKWI